jgi:hypothetical protein
MAKQDQAEQAQIATLGKMQQGADVVGKLATAQKDQGMAA